MPKRDVLRTFTHGGGHCWIAQAPAGFPKGDGIDDNDRSQIILYEDGIELGPAHAHHADIRSLGGGRFSHWDDSIFLSTSDNSDPNHNTRVYSIGQPDSAALGRDPKTIPEAADYALGIARGYLAEMRLGGIEPRGAHVLELGPGKNFGAAALLASAGAIVTVADPFLSPWIDGYHQQYFSYLAERWPDESGALARLIQDGSFDTVLSRLPHPAEDLSMIPDGVMDATLSSSVLEHLADFEQAFGELSRISRSGSVHVHSIDLKDHQGYGRYLEHLLMPAAEFAQSNERVQNQRGCQLRASEFLSLFGKHGLRVVEKCPDLTSDEAYFQDFLSRLRASECRYANWPEEDLRIFTLKVRSVRI